MNAELSPGLHPFQADMEELAQKSQRQLLRAATSVPKAHKPSNPSTDVQEVHCSGACTVMKFCQIVQFSFKGPRSGGGGNWVNQQKDPLSAKPGMTHAEVQGCPCSLAGAPPHEPCSTRRQARAHRCRGSRPGRVRLWPVAREKTT